MSIQHDDTTLLYNKTSESVSINTKQKKDYEAIKDEGDWSSRDFCLNMHEVSYTVEETIGKWYQGGCLRKKRTKRILNNISAQFKSGTISAIMGSSGKKQTNYTYLRIVRADWHRRGQKVLNSIRMYQYNVPVARYCITILKSIVMYFIVNIYKMFADRFDQLTFAHRTIYSKTGQWIDSGIQLSTEIIWQQIIICPPL